MDKKKYRILCWRLVELILAVIADYLFVIAVVHRQEAKDAVILAFLCIGVAGCIEIRKRIDGIYRLGLNFCLLVGVLLFLSCEICMFVGAKEEEKKNLSVDYIVVLGSKLDETGISETLRERLEKAIDIGREISVPIVVSGGNTRINSCQEADIMKEYLIDRGVKNEILVEDKALDTRHNFIYTAEMIGKDAQIVIVTSDIHMFRAKMLARHAGFKGIVGVCSKTDAKMYLYFNLREVVSIFREIMITFLGGIA